MSFGNENATLMTMPVQPAYQNGGFGGGYGMEWMMMWLWPLFLFCGYGGGFGGFGGGIGSAALQGALTRGDLCQDMNFQDLQNGVRGITADMNSNFRTMDNAICTLGYNQAQLVNGVERQIGNEFRGVDKAICTLGYNAQQIGSAIQQQIQQCCCENEKIAMQSRFDAQQYNCSTLQAIDKLGDRIIDYLSADKVQTLRDENHALRLAASQVAQNQYLVGQLRPPFPVPAYTAPNPFAPATTA